MKTNCDVCGKEHEVKSFLQSMCIECQCQFGDIEAESYGGAE